ncbi:MAG: beta-lactamase family protein [Actinomycetia bacterium]|nr:beta-lactamase family protein [Actinomycetes bacterium]
MKTPTRSRNRALLCITALAASVSLVAASCSNDGDPAAGDGTSTSAPGDEGALWSGPAPNTDEMSPEDAQRIDEGAQQVLAQSGGATPGAWVGIWDADTGKHIGAYGNAVIDGAEAKSDQSGRIGSVTKTFTATAMLQQVSEGWASFDDTVEDLLPDLAKKYPDVASVTVEQLVGMTSGIPDYANSDWFLPQVVADPTKVWTADEIIDQVLSRGDLSAPGTAGYSTTNYLILGEMLQGLVQGGGDIGSIITSLADNAGLTRTALPQPDDAELPDPYSNGYVTEPGVEELAAAGATVAAGTDVTDWSPSWGGAGGAMYANIEDLGQWAGGGLGTSLLSKDTGDKRISDTKSLPEGTDYGLGIEVWGDGWIGHTGQIIGWESMAAYNTDTGDVFVAIVNETGSLAVAVGIADQVYPELAERMAGL